MSIEKFWEQWLQGDMCKDWITEIPNDEKMHSLLSTVKQHKEQKFYDIKDHASSKNQSEQCTIFSFLTIKGEFL